MTTHAHRGIGIVGAAGAVGSAAARALHGWGRDLLLAGRRLEPLVELAAELDGAEVARVDIDDPGSLERFCARCSVVLNCAGPAYLIGDRVARAAAAAGVDYADAAGDDTLHDQVVAVARAETAPWTAAVSAGLMPGLTAVLPRYLSTTMPVGDRLIAYTGGRDRFTLTAAADYLRTGATFGQAGKALVGGLARSTPALAEVDLPFFPEQVTAMPFLSTELARVAAALRLPDAISYSVFAGGHLRAVMRRPDGGGAAALHRATQLDTFGHATYQLIVMELTASAEGTSSTMILRGSSASELTGAFAALATDAVRQGRIPTGVHHAGEVVDPVEAVALLRTTAAVDDLTVLSGAAHTTGGYLEEAI